MGFIIVGFCFFDVSFEFFAVFGEHYHFAVCASVGFDNDALVEWNFLLEEVSDVFFVMDFSAVLHRVSCVAGNENCFGNWDASFPEVEQGSEFAVAYEFDLGGVYGFFAEHFHDV